MVAALIADGYIFALNFAEGKKKSLDGQTETSRRQRQSLVAYGPKDQVGIKRRIRR